MELIADLQYKTDEQLQLLAASGDTVAEDVLAGRYVRLVRACSRPFFLAGGDSEDLIQEGMLGLLSAIRSYERGQNCSFRSYAELCIRRRLASAVRSAGRMKHSPLNDGVSLEEAFGEEERCSYSYASPDFRRIPEEWVLAKESAEELLQVYSQQLSAFEQQILELYLEGFSYQEMAERVGREEKAVDNAVQRIRRKLARNLISGEISIS